MRIMALEELLVVGIKYYDREIVELEKEIVLHQAFGRSREERGTVKTRLYLIAKREAAKQELERVRKQI